MKHLKLCRQIVNLRLLLENLCENKIESCNINNQLSMKIKVLFYISETVNCTPSMLIEKFCIAKSNLAVLCKILIKEGHIISTKNEKDKRNIFYNITNSGTEILNNYYLLSEENITKIITEKDIRFLERRIDELTTILLKLCSKKK